MLWSSGEFRLTQYIINNACCSICFGPLAWAQLPLPLVRWRSKTSLSLDSCWACAEFLLACDFLLIILFSSISSEDDEINNKTRFLDLPPIPQERDDDELSCIYGSECSGCSCGYCDDEDCRINGNYSICERWVEAATSCKARWKLFSKAQSAGATRKLGFFSIFFSHLSFDCNSR